MRIIHCADLHLGMSRYARTTEDGRNLRQVDIEQQFEALVDRVIDRNPDLVFIAGDVFHVARPANAVIVHALKHFQRLASAIGGGNRIVVIAGNHDLPRTNETCILRVLERLGIFVVDRAPGTIQFEGLDLSLTCVPEVHQLEQELKPDPSFRYNVLAIHGEAKGVIPKSRAPFVYEPRELAAGGWDYVGLGHFHDFKEVAPGVFYSGAIDLTTSDCWHESPEKGFIEFDTRSNTATFFPLPSPRPHVTIDIDGAGASVEELNDAISARAFEVNVVDKVVRVVLRNVDNATKRAIDPRMQRELRAIATHFSIENRALESERELIVGMAPRAQSLETELRAKLESIQITESIDRPQFVERGLKYFERTNSEAA